MTGEIDWARVAEPQSDGYDTMITQLLAKERYGWEKKWPQSGATWLDRAVLLESSPAPGENRIPASVDHPNLSAAEQFLREGYPVMYEQCRQLVQRVEVSLLADLPVSPLGSGVSCGPLGDLVSFEMSATINGGVGLLEGIVHELAHNKMKTHGISFQHWERLMTNPPATEEVIEAGVGPNLYVSPVRKDVLRPLGACISAHYSYLYVAETLLQLLSNKVIGPPENFVDWLDLHGSRIAEGQRLIAEDIRPDAAGELYFESMHDWGRKIIKQVESIKTLTPLRHSPNDNDSSPRHGDSFVVGSS